MCVNNRLTLRNQDPLTVVTDATIHGACLLILTAWWLGLLSQAEAYEQADSLTFKIWNCHPYGMAATEALGEVSFTIDVLQGYVVDTGLVRYA